MSEIEKKIDNSILLYPKKDSKALLPLIFIKNNLIHGLYIIKLFYVLCLKIGLLPGVMELSRQYIQL
jgi:hypothetical protein